MKRMFNVLGIIAILVMAVGFASPQTAQAAPAANGGPGNIPICHATAADSNPYTNPVVDADSIIKDSGHDSHNGPIWFAGITVAWGDIIPEFWYLKEDKNVVSFTDPGSDLYDHYAGKNWSAEGQTIWNAGCTIPAPPDQWTAAFTPRAECDDAWIEVAIFKNGEKVAEDVIPFGNVWSDPYNPETYDYSGTYSFEGHDFPYSGTFVKPAECLKKHEYKASFLGDSTCKDAWINVTIYEDDIVVFTDVIDLGNIWVKPFETEEYTFSDNYAWGELIFHYEVTIKEDESCLVTHEYAADFKPHGECDDAYLDVTVYQDGEPVFTDRINFGNVWVNPYETETYHAVGSYPWGEMSFPYDEWIQEPSDCRIVLPHNHKLKVDPSCQGWSVTPVSNDGGIFTPDRDSDPLTGLWSKPKEPEHVTVKGEWVWPDGKKIRDQVTVREPADCTKTKRFWKPTCPTCDLRIKGKERLVTWPTWAGDAGWKSRELVGELPSGVMTTVVIDDCTKNKQARCLFSQFFILEYDVNKLGGRKVELIDNGVNWPLPESHNGIGGQYVLYVGRVCTWQDTDRTKCHSSNDQTILIDGVVQKSFVKEGPNNLWYNYWLCSLPPSYAMTYFVDGKWQIQWLPGMDTWGGTIFWLKHLNNWPLGWPGDTSQHSWIWHLPPLSTARSWANDYREAGLFGFYPMP